MKTSKDLLWTRLSPDEPRVIDRAEWMRHGGKWIVFDKSDMIEALAGKLGPFIDSGSVESAKIWNGDPSAINVYSLDRNRWMVREILKRLGARYVLVWEYDYALGRNIFHPITFVYSWSSKFRTILASYGLAGTLRLLKEALKQKGASG